MKNVGFGFFAGALLAQAAATYQIQARYPLPGSGGWDYVTIDSSARRLYISHATQVEVVDADSGKMIGTIPDTPGVHGIALAPDFKHGFTSNGRENKVSMFDPATLKVIKKIDVGAGPMASTTTPHPSASSLITTAHTTSARSTPPPAT